MTTHTQKTQSMVRTTVSRCLVVGGALVLLSFLPQACSTHDILAVNIPNVIDPSQLNSPLGAAAAYAGAIGDFAFANDGDNGGTEGQILVSGVMTDEYIDSETFPTRIEYDSRGITRSEEHTSELQSHSDLVCRLLLEKKKKKQNKEQD